MSIEGNSHLLRFLQSQNAQLRDENQQLTEEVQALRRYIHSLQRFQETVWHFTPEQDVLALLEDTLDSAMALLDAADGSLLLLDEETDELVFVLVYGAIREILPGYRLDRHEGLAGWALDNAQPALVKHAPTDGRFFAGLDKKFGFQTRALVAVPLIARGHPLGVIEVLNKRSGEEFTDDDVALLSILSTLAASALDYAASTPMEE